MNNIHPILSVLLAAGIGIGSPVHAQVSETSGTTHTIIHNSGNRITTIRSIIDVFAEKIKNTDNNVSIMNEFERALIDVGIEDFNSFCSVTPYGTESGVIIPYGTESQVIKITYEKGRFKVNFI